MKVKSLLLILIQDGIFVLQSSILLILLLAQEQGLCFPPQASCSRSPFQKHYLNNQVTCKEGWSCSIHAWERGLRDLDLDTDSLTSLLHN